MHFGKAFVGPKPAQTGEQGTGTLCPREQTSESVCDAVIYESTRPLNLRTVSSIPLGHHKIAAVNAALQLACWRLVLVRTGFVLSLLFQECCIALVSGPGYFEAMLETAARC